jgi:HTH-type transcriptional regulator / antitoxin HigA
MDIRPIKSAEDYAWGLREIEAGMKAELQPGTHEGDRLDILMTIVEKYERDHFPMLPADPIEALKFRMDQEHLSVSDLLPVFGTRGRASEILQRKRRMSITIVRALSDKLGIPLNVLARDYALGSKPKSKPKRPQGRKKQRKAA